MTKKEVLWTTEYAEILGYEHAALIRAGCRCRRRQTADGAEAVESQMLAALAAPAELEIF